MNYYCPVGQLPADGVELKYSLRSICLFAPQIDEVILIGDRKPTWYLGHFIPVPHNPKLTGVANVLGKMLMASKMEAAEVAWGNDDFYWMKPWKLIPRRHMSSSPIRKSIHDSGFRKAQRILGEMGIEYKYDYELHTPISFDGPKMSALLESAGTHEPLSIRTLYGNVHWATESVPLLDVKTLNFHKPQDIRPFYSTGDSACTDPLFLRWAGERFPEVSRWEIDFVPRPKK